MSLKKLFLVLRLFGLDSHMILLLNNNRDYMCLPSIITMLPPETPIL